MAVEKATVKDRKELRLSADSEMIQQTENIIVKSAALESGITPQMRNLLILLAAIVVVLILVLLLFSGKSRFRRLLSLFLEERTDDEANGGEPNRSSDGGRAPVQRRISGEEFVQKRTSEPIVEMATLIRKSDDRLRIFESTGQVRLVDEYYELVFVTRKGQKLKIECSAEAYEKVPFNQLGSLTYKRNTLVKLKYYGDTVFN